MQSSAAKYGQYIVETISRSKILPYKMVRMKKTRQQLTSDKALTIHGLAVRLTHKNIKNLNLRIIPHEPCVKISVPMRMPIQSVYAFVAEKHDWITKQQKKLRCHTRAIQHHYCDGEKHEFFGKAYELKRIPTFTQSKAALNGTTLELHINQNTTQSQHQRVIENWYRHELKQRIAGLIKKYEQITKLQVLEFGVKKMKTRWGTCNPHARRIWLNLELAKKPIECLEYVVLHEMTHFVELKHNKRFYDYISRYIPDWKAVEKKLNSAVYQELDGFSSDENTML